MLETLQARMEDQARKQANDEVQRMARLTCLEATLQQLQASAARQQASSPSGAAWRLRTVLAPLAEAAHWLLNFRVP